MLMAGESRETVRRRVASEDWVRSILRRTREQVDPYVNRHREDPEWIVSRLQMYWKTRHTDVYINGGVYSHAEGRAPMPTVRFTGTRDATTVYRRPRLEDVRPYMDDPRGLYLQNGSAGGHPWEWAEQSKTGRIIESINREIMGLGEKAAFLYWYTGEEPYARFAFDLFDTYMTGMYYRKEPVDLSRGHHQTLVGLSSFEVIHEDILNELTACYDFLYPYLQEQVPDKMGLYGETFKKWADLIIQNGVTFNNWNLHQARFIAKIAVILENDQDYKDRKGCRYYLDQIMNQSSLRQWSLQELMAYGYDPETGIWNESPGYATGMVNDFLWFVELFDRQFDINLIPHMPVLPKAAGALLQYLYPNRYTVCFGDGHYKKLSPGPFLRLIRNAQKNGKPEQERHFTSLLKLVAGEEAGALSTERGGYHALFAGPALKIREDIPPARLEDVATPTFYAPNVSWLVQRSGTDPEHGLMISQAGSKGNHMHANGIAMELYGKGLVLVPEMGIGTSYFQIDYDEYYSRFPAHNTVVVDGISNYPVMKSSHAFELLGCFPEPGTTSGQPVPLTWSDVYFLEPETYADQRRVMGIIRTGDTRGYYVDIFRSRRRKGGDKRHDYFYHNLGRELALTGAGDRELDMQPTDKLAFADGDMMAYDYLWDKHSVRTDKDFKATFTLEIPAPETEHTQYRMHVWIKGAEGREIFTAKAPPSKAFRHAMIPQEIADLPVPTLVVRQEGEAWTRPFVAVYEPSGGSSSISSIRSIEPENAGDDFAGLLVESRSGRRDFIFSGTDGAALDYDGRSVQAGYAVISEQEGALLSLFMGNGTRVSTEEYSMETATPGTAGLFRRDENWHLTSDQPVRLTLPAGDTEGQSLQITLNGRRKVYRGKRVEQEGNRLLVFDLPVHEEERK